MGGGGHRKVCRGTCRDMGKLQRQKCCNFYICDKGLSTKVRAHLGNEPNFRGNALHLFSRWPR